MAGEPEQMPCVVHEFVHVYVTTEQRDRALVDADEVQRQQRQEHGSRQPQCRAGLRKVATSTARVEVVAELPVWPRLTPSRNLAVSRR